MNSAPIEPESRYEDLFGLLTITVLFATGVTTGWFLNSGLEPEPTDRGIHAEEVMLMLAECPAPDCADCLSGVIHYEQFPIDSWAHTPGDDSGWEEDNYTCWCDSPTDCRCEPEQGKETATQPPQWFLDWIKEKE